MKTKTIGACTSEDDYNKLISFIDWYNKESNKDLSVSQFVWRAVTFYCKAIQREYKKKTM